jgi:Spy/CpxP family protein refolding chaperone
MRKATWLVLTLALVVLVAAPPLLAEEAKAPAEGKVKAAAKEKSEAKEKSAPALKGEYAIMASELKLTAEQQTEVAAKLAAREESIAAWRKDNMQKLETAQEALKKARESGDKEAAKKLGEEIKAINESRDKIMTDTAAAIRAILTPEQQQAWEGFSLYRQAMARYRKAELTDDQHKKVRELCDAAAKELAAGKAKEEVRAKLDKDIEALLTPAQKAALKPAEKAGAEKAAAEKKPAEK